MNLTNWMSEFDPTRSITDFALPGTHDTMTASCDHQYYRTQTLELDEQLAVGVRFLDIRLRRSLVAAHREWISSITADQIFETTAEFLQKNPSETVIMRVQNANENKDDFPEYKEAILGKVKEYQDIFFDYSTLEADEAGNPAWPTLGQAAGKIVPLECAPTHFQVNQLDGKIWAANWHENPRIELQDLWDGPTVEAKKAAIEENLMASLEGAKEKLFLNHISATNGEIGYPAGYSDLINPWTAELWTQEKVVGAKGTQIYDFVTAELSQALIAINR